jgi:curli biogenesis system outer membrane secretion channel CsgG
MISFKTSITALLLSAITLFLMCPTQKEPKQKKHVVNQDFSTNRYRLKNIAENYFDTAQNSINISIPVTDSTLAIYKQVNISSNKIDAILIWLKGENKQTSCKIVKHLKKTLRFDDLSSLNMNKLRNEKKLLVAIFNNDELTESDIEDFKKLIRNSIDYETAVMKLNSNNKCSRGSVFEPRESGGDIIGGI